MNYSHCDSKKNFLDDKLIKLFNNKKNGFYIELGANDGISQSNSAKLEFENDWSGILIEPSSNSYEKCKNNRVKSICLNYACVSKDYTSDEINGDFNGDLMSSVDGKRLNSSYLTAVKATTLEKILEKYYPVGNIDFLSLDTEGYELNILKGLNLNKFRPNYMLIEIYSFDFNNILEFLNSNNYTLVSNFTNYNRIDNPGWDGTHNDYLFKDNLL
jgi:FkbM family methyltransferase